MLRLHLAFVVALVALGACAQERPPALIPKPYLGSWECPTIASPLGVESQRVFAPLTQAAAAADAEPAAGEGGLLYEIGLSRALVFCARPEVAGNDDPPVRVGVSARGWVEWGDAFTEDSLTATLFFALLDSSGAVAATARAPVVIQRDDPEGGFFYARFSGLTFTPAPGELPAAWVLAIGWDKPRAEALRDLERWRASGPRRVRVALPRPRG